MVDGAGAGVGGWWSWALAARHRQVAQADKQVLRRWRWFTASVAPGLIAVPPPRPALPASAAQPDPGRRGTRVAAIRRRAGQPCAAAVAALAVRPGPARAGVAGATEVADRRAPLYIDSAKNLAVLGCAKATRSCCAWSFWWAACWSRRSARLRPGHRDRRARAADPAPTALGRDAAVASCGAR